MVDFLVIFLNVDFFAFYAILNYFATFLVCFEYFQTYKRVVVIVFSITITIAITLTLVSNCNSQFEK